MHRLSEELLCSKLKEAHSLGFIKDIFITDTKKNEKVIGREIIFDTGIGNTKAKENCTLIKCVKKQLEKIFGKTIKERVNSCGVAELSVRFERKE